MRDLLRLAIFSTLLIAGATCLEGQTAVAVSTQDAVGSFAMIQSGRPADVLIDADADAAVKHVAKSFVEDLNRVSGEMPRMLGDLRQAKGEVVVLGVLHHSAVIDELVREGRIEADDLDGQWEAYRQIVVEHPFPNVARALVIVGSDRRGVVYGTYDLSEKLGVSPWYWFADVPVRRQANIFVSAGSRRDQPRVKYRGFFINDENPSFDAWAKKHFGGFNARMYERVFELDLRLKGDYLWPAMWAPKAFAADDPQNMVLADQMGVVMGTSHHEPMMRAQDEWHRHTDQGVTGGKWDYTTNSANLRTFWRGGIERMMSKGDGKAYESMVTVGMRGDGDEPMAEGTATQLLETIVADQRKIIADVTGKPADQTPQMWALYKEVQDYYDHGMKVPDDVTLLFSDDNWGQLRRLPDSGAERKGGYGIYYHFDYVGSPRNYKWINTNQIEKTWQQMDLAYASGARALWIVNVGDIKPMEFPLSFFMQQAWNPEAMTLEELKRYPEAWAAQTFGPSQAADIAHLITRYSQLAARRKPELVDANTFQLGDVSHDALDGGEFGARIAEWQQLEEEMRAVTAKLPKDQLDAYFELVEHPILALSNLYELYYDVAWNHRLAEANDSRANTFADRAEVAFRRDQELTDEYHSLHHGKWDGMMLQTHIGYDGWQEPAKQVMPALDRVASKASPMPIVFAKISSDAPARGENDFFSIEAPDYTRAAGGDGLTWGTIPHLGRTLGAVTAFPQGHASTTAANGIHLEYDVDLNQQGDVTVQLVLVPTLDTTGKGALHVGLSVDGGPVRTLTSRLVPAPNDASTQEQKDWNKTVEDNAIVLQSSFPELSAGRHTIKVWRLDGNVVVQELVVGHGLSLPRISERRR